MKPSRMFFAFSGVLLICAAVVFAGAAPEDAPDISLADLKQAMTDKQVCLIDCNGSASYASGHIPGAIDFEANKTDLQKMLPADKSSLLVAYCGGPKCLAYRAGAAAAARLGYTNIRHFSGGLSGWEKAGGKLEPAPPAANRQSKEQASP